uniref:Uncharacterized protein n=1 Tax=Dulem virus 230 TaxID=3145707 RepID=A0AAU8B2N7_9VIRU
MEKKQNCLYDVVYSVNGHSYCSFRSADTFELAYVALCELVNEHRELYSHASLHPEVSYSVRVFDFDLMTSYCHHSFTVHY